MNYRHAFHAGNFADVVKHVVLIALVRAMQRKEKACLILDTHAGRGGYDLARSETGRSLPRNPEHPLGIGRINRAANPPPAVRDYLGLVRAYDRACGHLGPDLRFYPGSPAIAQSLLRPQDRLICCELEPGMCAALRRDLARRRGVAIQARDGYAALRALLPPPERRALVLLDPAFESQDEWSQLTDGLAEALRRFPSGVYALWYPLTGRAQVDLFFERLASLDVPPTLAAELEVAGSDSGLRLRGCGLVIVNPPWRIERSIGPAMEWLAGTLAQGPGAQGSVRWMVRDPGDGAAR